MISRMFVHVNKDPLFLSHASLETSLSHLGGGGLWIPQPIMTPEFWPLSIHELKEKRERERKIACFMELWFSRMLVFVSCRI